MRKHYVRSLCINICYDAKRMTTVSLKKPYGLIRENEFFKKWFRVINRMNVNGSMSCYGDKRLASREYCMENGGETSAYTYPNLFLGI